MLVIGNRLPHFCSVNRGSSVPALHPLLIDLITKTTCNFYSLFLPSLDFYGSEIQLNIITAVFLKCCLLNTLSSRLPYQPVP